MTFFQPFIDPHLTRNRLRKQRALIVVPVRINQKGPFDFMVDTLLCLIDHSVFRNAINALRSSSGRSSPNLWPFTANVLTPYGLKPVGT
jgi:hypothetical protein